MLPSASSNGVPSSIRLLAMFSHVTVTCQWSMFHNSTQRRHWMFESLEEINKRRHDVNKAYCTKAKVAVPEAHFLSPSEEEALVRYYMKKLLELCTQFQPPVPRSTIATAANYLKRYYLTTSVMDYHPRDIYLCCAFIAFKVDEYNLDADQFVQCFAAPDAQKRVADTVLAMELMMMQKLNFEMLLHSPFRPVEGMLLDLKTKCPLVKSPDSLRKVIDRFLMHSFYSDVCLLYPPSQIALAALKHSAAHSKVNIDSYILQTLLGGEQREARDTALSNLARIEKAVLAVTIPSSEQMRPVELKLEKCRNQDNNPDNERFWRKKKKEDKESEPPASKKRKVEEEDVEDIFQLKGKAL